MDIKIDCHTRDIGLSQKEPGSALPTRFFLLFLRRAQHECLFGELHKPTIGVRHLWELYETLLCRSTTLFSGDKAGLRRRADAASSATAVSLLWV